MNRLGLHQLAPSGASDGDVMVWSDALNMWVPSAAAGGAVDSVNGHTGTVVLGASDVGADPAGAAAAAQAASQPLDADLTAVAAVGTQAYGRNLLALSNQTALMAALASSTTTLQGIVELATSAETLTGTDAVRAVTPAGLQAKIDALVASAPGLLDTLDEIAAALNDDPNFAATMTTALAAKAPLASPVFTGNPTAPTPAAADNDTSIPTTAWVQTEIAAKAPLASPVFTGNPTAPTPATADNDQSLATTNFVHTVVDAGVASVPPPFLIPPLKSGNYYGNPFAGSGSNTTALSAGTLELHPFPVSFAVTIDQLIAECTAIGAAGRLRLGIYNSDNAGNPNALVIDAGQVTGAAAGARSAAISQLLPAGQYYLACLHDVVGGTWRTWPSTPVAAVLGYNGGVAGSAAYTRLQATGVAVGALPATAPATTPISSGTGGMRLLAHVP